MKPNGPCHCGSEKRFKKCCRNPKNMKEPAKLAGQIFNQWIEKDLANVFVRWPRLIFKKNVIADEDIEPWTPVTIFPVHFISIDNSLFPANIEATRFRPGRPITLTENTDDVSAQIAASPKIMRENQLGHVVTTAEHSNVFLYHAGMYSLMYVSHERIPKGTEIVAGSTNTAFREQFVNEHSKLLAAIEYHYLQAIRRFLVLYQATDSWSEEQNIVLREIYKTLSEI